MFDICDTPCIIGTHHGTKLPIAKLKAAADYSQLTSRPQIVSLPMDHMFDWIYIKYVINYRKLTYLFGKIDRILSLRNPPAFISYMLIDRTVDWWGKKGCRRLLIEESEDRPGHKSCLVCGSENGMTILCHYYADRSANASNFGCRKHLLVMRIVCVMWRDDPFVHHLFVVDFF